MSQHDDLFQELGRTLDVAPSRDFAKGVHARIARRRLIVRSTGSGLAIAASLLLVVVMRGPATVTLPEPSRIADAISPAPTAPTATPHRVRPAIVRGTQASTPRTPSAVQPSVESDDRLLVVTNQMAVLRAAWAGHLVTAEETAAPAAEVLTVPEAAPIAVEPVRVPPVVIADQRAPINGIPVIRRAVAALETK